MKGRNERYSRIRRIGSGGNGEVWLCRKGETEYAVKFLRRLSEKRYARFQSEVAVVRSLGGLPGIVPILDSHLPDNPTRADPALYAMPVGKRIPVEGGADPEQVVQEFLEIADALVELHSRGIYHRDIKPQNFLLLGDRWCIGDFGLAEWSDAPDVTGSDEEIGPLWTKAPEMRRFAWNAAGGPADVYSFAKSLWIILSGEPKGFDGQYDRTSSAHKLRNHLEISEWLRPVEALLEDCTNYDPDVRPSMWDVASRLREWVDSRGDFHRRCLLEWRYLQRSLFPTNPPVTARWDNAEDIASVLSEIASSPNLSHCHFDTGGGLDLEGVSVTRDGLLECDFGPIYVVRPNFLEMARFHTAPENSYFWLELAELERIGIDEGGPLEHEEFVRMPDGAFLPLEAWHSDQFEDEEGGVHALPAGAELIRRVFRGAWLLVAKRSPYNRTPKMYDGRHAKLGRNAFFELIRQVADRSRSE